MSQSAVGKFSGPLLSATWRRMKDFAGLDNDATYLWPRWLILRAVGLVFIVILCRICSWLANTAFAADNSVSRRSPA